uniref:Uncharacterized protein n=1 Tax=Romanomermis culicivorax TaxID=13658 RepID=A0A915KB45_ROMCU
MKNCKKTCLTPILLVNPKLLPSTWLHFNKKSNYNTNIKIVHKKLFLLNFSHGVTYFLPENRERTNHNVMHFDAGEHTITMQRITRGTSMRTMKEKCLPNADVCENVVYFLKSYDLRLCPSGFTCSDNDSGGVAFYVKFSSENNIHHPKNGKSIFIIDNDRSQKPQPLQHILLIAHQHLATLEARGK